MPKYEDLINKEYSGNDIELFKRVLEVMPTNERLDWDNVDLGDNINYHLVVWFNEDTWPHFHIISDDGSFETSLSILEPSYYYHKNIQPLTNLQIYKLIEYLNESLDGYYTRWNCICQYWRDFNVDKIYLYKENFQDNNANLISIPDYKFGMKIKYADTYYKENV